MGFVNQHSFCGGISIEPPVITEPISLWLQEFKRFYIGTFCGSIHTGAMSGATLFIQKQYGLSSIMKEVVVSSVLVGAIIGAVIGGALCDRYGRRKLIILAGVIFTISAIGYCLFSVSYLADCGEAN